jgi:mannose-1-phosphate guanylyltransferase
MELGDIHVAVLAGGKGSRLQSVLPRTPKILAPLGRQPLLAWLLDQLAGQGARRVTLCLGHLADQVIDWIKAHPRSSVKVEWIVEPKPLGTAGALLYAMRRMSSDPLLALNGDTLLDVDLNEFLAAFSASRPACALVRVHVEDTSRYGRLELDGEGYVVRFLEKDPLRAEPGWINGGYYLFSARFLQGLQRLEQGSLEHDVLAQLPPGSILTFPTCGRFLDIGTPESLRQAEEVFRK